MHQIRNNLGQIHNNLVQNTIIWAKKLGDLGQNRNNLGHRFGPKNSKFRAKNIYISLVS